MKVSSILLSTAAVASASSIKRDTVPAVTVKGNAFFANGERFYIRGVDYQPGGSSNAADPIADATSCQRDIKYFKQLGINAVRVYTVDNTANHDTCMNALAAAGIYLILDVNTPKYSLNRANPNPSYNAVYLQSIFATIDAFQGYSNTLAFFSGNEVVNDGPTSAAAPYVKAVTRDMRQYIKSRGYRAIPVGYSAADVSQNRLQMAEYMNCGADEERSDFFAFNDYSWCDPSTFTQSGWDQKVKTFSGYGIPIFLSEYGCNTNTREFTEVAALYNTEMTGVYSGGLVYEYSQEETHYGLVEINGDGSISTLPDFTALMNAFQNTSNPSGDGGYNSAGAASQCPTETSSDWAVSGDSIPAFPDGAKQYMSQGAGTGPGLSGLGSQDAGSAATATAAAGTSSATPSSSSTSTANAAPAQLSKLNMMTPFAVSAVLIFSCIFGATLL